MKVNHLGERYNMRWGGVLFTALGLIVMLLAGCKHGEQPPEEEETVLTVSSSAFQEKDRIPSMYSCQGEDVSPPLA